MDSILTSIKDMLGIPEEHNHFDKQIIAHINTVFGTLNQLGVGPLSGFSIKDDTSIWSDFLSDMTEYESVKSYTYLNVRLLFDPPASSTITETITRQIDQLEWRLNVTAESKNVDDDNNQEQEDCSHEARIEDDALILS